MANDMTSKPFSPIVPKHYALADGKDLLNIMEMMMTPEEYRGFIKGCIIKYTVRYGEKDGIQDLDKVGEYTRRLKDFEERHGQK